MDREEFLRLYARSEKDFTGKSFRGANWIDRIVIGGIYHRTDFSQASFIRSGFDKADLSFARFIGARMYESGFGWNCYMEGVDFSYAVFSQCNFSRVDLSRVIFKNATISETSFTHANLSYADLSGAKEFDSCSCRGTIFYATIMPDGSVRTDNV
jgi:uncharacterized protein YjbI with pentapeptide repeats